MCVSFGLSVGVAIAVVFCKLLLLVTLDIFLTDCFFDTAFDPSKEVGFNLFSFNVFIKDKLKLDLLWQLIELELPIVTQVWRWEKWV